MRICIRVLAVVTFVLFFSSFTFAQDLGELKGVQLLDGTVIYGKVIKSNVDDVIIEKEDGEKVSVKFNEVSQFLRDEQAGDITNKEKIVSYLKKGNGLYIGANVGLAMLRDSDVENFSPTITFQSDPGYALGAAIGYGFDYGRIEAEVSYQRNDMDKIKVLGIAIDASGNSSNIALLLNGYIDFKNNTIVTPYLSAGIGVSRVDISGIGALGFSLPSYDDTVFAYQVGAGLGFSLTEKVILDLKYRYLGTSDPEFDNVKVNYGSHNVYLGVRYTF